MSSLGGNPSDMLDLQLVFAPDAVVAAADVNLTTGIDVSQYDHVLVILTLGTGDTAVTCKAQESDTATVSGGGYVDIAGATQTLGATDDNKAAMFEVRCHGLKQYMNINVTGSGGITSDVSVHVLGFGRQYTAEYAVLTTDVAELGLA